MRALLIIAASLVASLPLCGADADAIGQRGPLKLSMRRAVQMATSPEGNARIQLQAENVKQAKARAAEVRSLLLPDIESYTSIVASERSLAAQGLTAQNLVGVPAGLANLIPQRVGPFHTLDVRATMTGTIFDFSLIRRYQSARAGLKSAEAEVGDTDDSVVGQVSRAYLAALRTDAEAEAAQADVSMSEAVLKQSQNQKQAGSGTGIDVTRSDVELANQKQRLLMSRTTQVRAHLTLLRAMNLRMDTVTELTDKLTYKPLEAMSVEDSVAKALANRPDYQVQLKREDTARLNASSVKFERLPSIVIQGDYGTLGPQDVTLLPTRDIYASVRLPIFDGGRRDARRGEAFSQSRQEQVRSRELHDQIELDVRVALDSLHSADEQVAVAQSGLKLAESELTQARRRYDAGVAVGLEVTDASTRVERARTNQIEAIYNHSLARLDLGQAMGRTLSMVD